MKDALDTNIRGREEDNDEAGNKKEGSRAAVEMGQAAWPVCDDGTGHNRAEGKRMDARKLKQIFASARASQQRGDENNNTSQPPHRDASIRESKAVSSADVHAWLEAVRQRTDKRGRPLVKKKQLEVVEIVAQRICKELEAIQDPSLDPGEPLIWCVHGLPGTGKSFVLKLIRELFDTVMGWNMGLEYQMAALQAVMAEQLGGDTIHHACGIDPFMKQDGDPAKWQQKQQDVAKRVLQWRWLIIDEISMVSAKLLAEIDMKLRDVIRSIGTLKNQADGIDRAFGGVNLLLAGDFWQLDPPSGGCLASIPVEFMKKARKYDAAATVAHGQSVFWHQGPGCVQGVTELDECIRCKDEWLREVQDEMRHGQLSHDNHNFLHGRPTTVPGSWVNGRPLCGNRECEKLAQCGSGS